MDHFEEWNLVPLLVEAIDRGVVVVGMSAGVQALATWYVHEDVESQETKEGWNITGKSIGVLEAMRFIHIYNEHRL